MQMLLTSLLLLSGTAFMLIAAIGMVRLPDVFCRAHALTKAITIGLSLLLLALWCHRGDQLTGFKVLLAIAFQFLTVPVAGHLFGLLAYQKNVPRWKPRRRE